MKYNFFNYYTRLKEDENVIISYKGSISEALIMEMCGDIRESLGASPEITQKIFSIFIELSRNVIRHSIDKNLYGNHQDPVGLIVLSDSDNYYSLTTGNLTHNHSFKVFKEKCEQINTFERSHLRNLKREQRLLSYQEDEHNNHAGIGLIRVALTSTSPIILDYVELDNQFTFFTLTTQIHKNKLA
jgi:hypothetical protein